MKKRDNLPLNYKERLNSRTSFLVSVAVLVVLCLVFNQMDYTMIRQPAAQAKKAADLQKQKEEEATTNWLSFAFIAFLWVICITNPFKF